jgi:hypothetical protein
MVLVVAVLGLLAVIGTVYIVSARASRNTAAATSVNANLDLARAAVMSQVQQTMGAAVIDASGAPGGYAATGTYGALAARNFDYPETNAGTGYTSYNMSMRDEPWLAASLYNSSGNDFSSLNAANFDPLNGKYDFAPSSTFSYSSTIPGTTNVVGDYFSGPASAYDPGSTAADAYISLLPFSEASGIRYRYGLRIIDTNRMANLNTGAPGDSASYPDATGAYLTSYSLAANYTTSQQQNFFCGTPATFGMLGTNDIALSILNPSNVSIPRTGRLGTTLLTSPSVSSFSPPGWQSTIFKIERASSAIGDYGFFDLTDELELRSYGNRGTLYQPRAASGTTGAATEVWPNTLAAYVPNTIKQLGNSRRGNYTTYSFSRELRPYPDPTNIYTLSTLTGVRPANVPTTIWPTSPANTAFARVAANPVVDISSAANQADAAFYIAMAATNIATAMESCSGGAAVVAPTNVFTHEEAVAFAANYMTARWNGFCADTAVNTGVPNAYAWYLPNGPSFVDGTGLCFRAATWGGTSTAPTAITPVARDFGGGSAELTTASLGSSIVSLGYSAQPFINEIAAFEGQHSSTGAPVYQDWAVELYNPYPVALSLNGFQLMIGANVIPLTTDSNGKAAFIPAEGYYVIFGNGSHFSGVPHVTAGSKGGFQSTITSIGLTGTETNAILYRPYCPRGSANASVGLAPIDTMDVTALLSISGLADLDNGGVLTEYDVARNNDNTSSVNANLWGASVAVTATRMPTQSIGSYNQPTKPGGFALADRFAQASPVPSAQASPMGMGEFSRTIRLANEFSTAAVPATPTNAIATHLGNLMSAAPYNSMAAPIEAQIRFDFYADPSIYATSPPTDPTGKHDIRAIRLLDELAMIDRVSDYGNTVNGVTGFDIQKIRLPGQINVNTASGDVLRAIPNMTDQMVANILAYRTRDFPTGTPGSATYNGVSSASYDPATYPGHGIRSLGELLVPLSTVQPASLVSPDQYLSGTLDYRDEAWGNIYNLCTVRSDTFAVYGYMEAVKQNPADTTFNNGSDWYTASNNAIYTASSTIDDPHNAGPLIRVARRRWVAIVDRSFSNYAAGTANFSLPRVVAIKDLPQ